MIHSGAIIGASFSQYVVLGSNMLRDIELQDLMTAGGGSVSRPMVEPRGEVWSCPIVPG